jgi:hypothetical protein
MSDRSNGESAIKMQKSAICSPFRLRLSVYITNGPQGSVLGEGAIEGVSRKPCDDDSNFAS